MQIDTRKISVYYLLFLNLLLLPQNFSWTCTPMMKMSSSAVTSYSARGSKVQEHVIEQTVHNALWTLGVVYSLWPLPNVHVHNAIIVSAHTSPAVICSDLTWSSVQEVCNSIHTSSLSVWNEILLCRYWVWVAVLNRGLSAFPALLPRTVASTHMKGGYYVPHRLQMSELRNKMITHKNEHRAEVLFIPFRGYRH